jgi:hypothetical protein
VTLDDLNKVLGPRTDNNLGVVLHRHNIESPIKTQQNRYSFVTERAPHQDFVHVLFKRPSPPPATAPPLAMGTLGRMGTFSLARQFEN